MTSAEVVGLACHIGPARAIEFVEFARELDKLSDQQRKLLLRGWLALEAMPKDASLERADLLRVLTGLRQAWQSTERKT